MICIKCGKDMITPEHQLDHTWYLCRDCYKKFVAWVNQEDQDVEELKRRLQEQKLLAVAAVALIPNPYPYLPLTPQMLPPLTSSRNEPKGFEGVLE